MRNKPYFNVIIPTRERANTLFHCLRTVVAQDYADLNIIVSDNFSNDETRQVVESFNDPRITYINTGKRISMSHNWEFALSHVSEGWVSFLGDDDGLMPGCLAKVAQIIMNTACDAIITSPGHYFWPDSKVWDERLLVPTTVGLEKRNSKAWLARLMNGATSYTELPTLYNGGFAKKSVIDSARDNENRFFLSMTPDVYSAIAIASVTDAFIKLNEPVFVGGASSHSNGASWFGGDKNPKPSAIYFAEDNIPCHKTLVTCQVKSIPILTYECYLQASHLHTDFLDIKLSDQLELAIATASPEHYQSVLAYCSDIAQRNNLKIRQTSIKMLIQALRFKLARFNRRINQVALDPRDFGVKDIFDASAAASVAYEVAIRHKHWKIKNLLRLSKASLKKISTSS